jgi:hypothetical protein
VNDGVPRLVRLHVEMALHLSRLIAHVLFSFLPVR